MCDTEHRAAKAACKNLPMFFIDYRAATAAWKVYKGDLEQYDHTQHAAHTADMVCVHMFAPCSLEAADVPECSRTWHVIERTRGGGQAK
jgi:hypothetical protein